MTAFDPRSLLFCKPALPTDPNTLAGYQYLHLEEARYTHQALEQVPEAVENWYEYLSLLVELVRGDYERTTEDSDISWNALNLRAHFASAGCATSKMALDATLSGHYSQARGLMRHMLETWMRIVNLRQDPSVSRLWMGNPGGPELIEPSAGYVLRRVKKLSKTEPDRSSVESAEALIEELHKGAHPSRILVKQLYSEKPGISRFGGNLNMELLLDSMSRGTIATIFLITEAKALRPFDDQQRSIFERLQTERDGWHRQYGSNGDGSTANHDEEDEPLHDNA